jgi:hypothetical protein
MQIILSRNEIWAILYKLMSMMYTCIQRFKMFASIDIFIQI